MTALKLQLIEPQQNTETLREQLEAELNECTEANATGKNHVRNFMVANGIWHISELNYPLRKQFEALLQEKYSDNACRKYLLAYDRIKQYSISKELQIFTKGKHQNSQYRNEIFYLPYYPDSELNGQFLNIVKKEILIWDFTIDVAEVMKRQIFTILCDMVRTQRRRQSLTEKLSALLDVYHYCCDEAIEDIEQMELEQAQKFTTVSTHSYDKGIIEYCRKILFLQSEEIPWQAPVWYLERFHLQPERTDPSNPVRRISFLEVTNKRNRSILQKYFRYALGVTNLSIGNIRSEHNYVRNFLVWLNQPEDLDICSAATEQIDGYFKELQQKSMQAASYNDQVMAILHFFNFLLVRKYIERIPFSEDLYLKKEIPVHHNRSVEQEVAREILSKLYRFPEEIRLIYLHLWAVGLRISEICSLKGNAYYVQGRDAWIQVYQNKMRNYKRIPIPTALYKLMQVYLKKHQIKSDDYVFQNQKGGAYRSATFRWKMKECCRENNIQYGEYIFQCHDYRHTVATNFYDTGVSIQSVRDYLGHSYEEMTQQYLDHMPKKIDKANEEYFSQHKSLAAGLLKKGGDKK